MGAYTCSSGCRAPRVHRHTCVWNKYEPMNGYSEHYRWSTEALLQARCCGELTKSRCNVTNYSFPAGPYYSLWMSVGKRAEGSAPQARDTSHERDETTLRSNSRQRRSVSQQSEHVSHHNDEASMLSLSLSLSLGISGGGRVRSVSARVKLH